MEPVEYRFLKARVLKGFAFPLKRSVLDEALGRCQLRHVGFVSFSEPLDRRLNPDLVALTYFHGEGTGVTGMANSEHLGTASIHFYAVPLGERPKVERAIRNQVLPRLCAWLKRAELEGNVWRAMNHRIEFKLLGDRVVQVEQ